MKRTHFFYLTVLTFLLALTFGYWNGWMLPGSEQPSLSEQPHAYAQTVDDSADTPPEPLPVVGSYANLKALLQEAENTRFLVRKSAMAMERAGAADTSAGSPTSSGAADFSRTNVQVAGVDEADVVKTDGTYLYLVRDRQVAIAAAAPADQMSVVNVLTYAETSFQPAELYVDERYLVVIGHDEEHIAKPPYNRPYVKAIVYDLRDKANLQPVKEVALEGYYLTSRKIGSALYLVANQYLDPYYILNETEELPPPVYRDSSRGNESIPVDYRDIRYFPPAPEPSYLLIGGINLDNPEQAMQVATYLGVGEHVYASTENLYVAVTNYEDTASFWYRRPLTAKTALYKFALNNGTTTYRAKGEVPGRILNQFSLDEHDGYFRVATTSGEIWRNDEQTSQNNLYILDEKLALAGKIEGIAPGEKIYSVRFMGDRGYMVTFKKVDPLFVLDLKNPQEPKILGKLKIPGYSDYLHPYDENHLIGFGKDAVEASWEGKTGSGPDTTAFYQGMKVALFDVSNVANPLEKFSLVIGDRGTDSELLHNHKALLFSKEKNLLAFPVTVYEIPESVKQQPQRDVTRFGNFSFQGAYVYEVDLDKGFTLRQTISHLTKEDLLRAGDGWYESSRNVERIVYINDTLYTLSQAMIKAHDLATFAEVGSLTLPDTPQTKP